MKKLAREYGRKWTSAAASAEHNIGNQSLHVQAHGRMFERAIAKLRAAQAKGDAEAVAEQTQIAARQAAHLAKWAHEAIGSGNLILNGGRPVAEVMAQLDKAHVAYRDTLAKYAAGKSNLPAVYDVAVAAGIKTTRAEAEVARINEAKIAAMDKQGAARKAAPCARRPRTIFDAPQSILVGSFAAEGRAL